MTHCFCVSWVSFWNEIHCVVSFEASCWCKKEMSPYWEVRLKYMSLIMKKVPSCLTILSTSVLTLAGCFIIVGYLSVCLPDWSENLYKAGIVLSKYKVFTEHLLSKQVNINSKAVKSSPQSFLGNCWWEDYSS